MGTAMVTPRSLMRLYSVSASSTSQVKVVLESDAEVEYALIECFAFGQFGSDHSCVKLHSYYFLDYAHLYLGNVVFGLPEVDIEVYFPAFLVHGYFVLVDVLHDVLVSPG
jgi:hypothetical protein